MFSVLIIPVMAKLNFQQPLLLTASLLMCVCVCVHTHTHTHTHTHSTGQQF